MLVISSKKTDCDPKVNEIENKIIDHSHDEYITTPDFNKSAAENFAAGLEQVNLLTKTDFDNKLSNLNKKNYFKQNKILNSSKGIKKFRNI